MVVTDWLFTWQYVVNFKGAEKTFTANF